ncbi:cytochrome c oxidase assembly protein [Brevibacillus ginsengisoli]|uniref:cytochrome c oxidase assembly protein n=1 Tax=Brevibacillus ginsengisoli TaxID=363854 RepID=UPI003CF69498
MHHHLQNPTELSIMELWRPDILLVLIGIGFWYLMKSSAFKTKRIHFNPQFLRGQVYFLLGLLLFYIALGTPLAYYGHGYSFSLHMIQQALTFFVAAPFILLGTPTLWIRSLFGHRLISPVLGLFTKPLLSVVLFNMLFSLYHVPLVFDTLHAHPVGQVLYHILLQGTAFCMWWPVLCPLRNGKSLSHLKKVGYMFANGVLLTPACALIIFADTLLYSSYQTTLPFITLLSPLEDQQLGGVLMKLIQEIVYATVIGLIFFRWYREENPREIDQLTNERNW